MQPSASPRQVHSLDELEDHVGPAGVDPTIAERLTQFEAIAPPPMLKGVLDDDEPWPHAAGRRAEEREKCAVLIPLDIDLQGIDAI